jgi:hypothetical protein
LALFGFQRQQPDYPGELQRLCPGQRSLAQAEVSESAGDKTLEYATFAGWNCRSLGLAAWYHSVKIAAMRTPDYAMKRRLVFPLASST